MTALNELREDVGEDFPLLLEQFLRYLPKRVAAVCDAHTQRQPERLAQAAHTLKGSCVQMGLTDLAAVARELEQAGRSGRSDAADPALVARLREELPGVLRILEQLLADSTGGH